MAQLAGMPPHDRAAHLAAGRARILERRERQAVAARRASEITEAEARVDRHILDEALRGRSVGGLVVTLPVPSGRTEEAPLPDERRRRYRRHLERTLEEALGASPGSVTRDREDGARERAAVSERFLAERPGLRARTERACGICKGGCCVAGGDHAFVSTVTIRRILDTDPSLGADEILETYLDHLPDRSIRGACVNQTATGCALPRAWRSDTCNAYLCRALETFHERWEESDPPEAILVIRRAHADGHRFDAEGSNPVVEVTWMDEDPTSK